LKPSRGKGKGTLLYPHPQEKRQRVVSAEKVSGGFEDGEGTPTFSILERKRASKQLNSIDEKVRERR